MPLPTPEVLEVRLQGLAARVDSHESTLGDHEEAIQELSLWRARLQGQLAAYAAVGAVLGSLLPKIVEYLAK